jgi:hypothetical protein
MGEDLKKALNTLLGGADDTASRAMKILAQLIESRFDGIENQNRDLCEGIRNVHVRISALKNEMDTVRFFSKNPKVLLAFLIAVIILVGSGLQNIFSFFAKLL